MHEGDLSDSERNYYLQQVILQNKVQLWLGSFSWWRVRSSWAGGFGLVRHETFPCPLQTVERVQFGLQVGERPVLTIESPIWNYAKYLQEEFGEKKDG